MKGKIFLFFYYLFLKEVEVSIIFKIINSASIIDAEFIDLYIEKEYIKSETF